MERTVLFAILLWLKMSSSLRCYKCNPEYSYYEHLVPVCDHFNTSDQIFNVECPQSTMCTVRFTTMDRGNGYIANAVKRDCGFQTVEEQIFVKRKWIFVNITYEPYTEGSFEHIWDEDRVTKTVSYYCRGDLCNTMSNIYLSDFTNSEVTTVIQGACTTPVPDSADMMSALTTFTILLPFGITLLH